ncbi:hypothetical protein AVEN_53631-1 [Araneus ventricosus]|uniref:Uncharacterized protein n=1 Tax=Araneus ventricosus TaxID=182803 RepID=A0A4Y2RK07_ARAVE|nr:hypothetical protein AVEN_53631-1 [Araneus ventricosus]
METEALFINLTRLKHDITINDTTHKAEDKAEGWSHHPAISFEEDKISTEEVLNSVGQINIYTNGSKMDHRVGTAYCAFDEQQQITKTWQAKLRLKGSHPIQPENHS